MSLISNTATTADNHADAFWQTRRFASTLADARRIIEHIIPTQSTYTRRWRHIETRERRDDNNAQPTGFDIIVEVPVIIFTDDLVVTVRSDKTNGEVAVDARSSSRIGRHDFGENRRHIAQFLRALDKISG
ncbi:MAG: DUF1499 domain-containing protein [Pyrinomonadaceae bacterium MAG19_C2-C3]|nr:DUF1499 domain-containing protein [Pyrinomonadaceae bacterium MAG19_C2-C3]